VTRSKPRLAIVSSKNATCANAYFSNALRGFLDTVFDVEIIDLKSYQLLLKDGLAYQQQADVHIDEICRKLQEFDFVNVQLELSLFGRKNEQILPRVRKICQASNRLLVSLHRLDITGGNAAIYRTILELLKKRPATNPFHILVHLPREKILLEEIYGIKQVTDFPVIFLKDAERERFQTMRNRNAWKKQFGLKEEDITIGVFGILSGYKNYTHALKTIETLPDAYKLLIVGETWPGNIKELQVDPVVQEITSYIDNHPKLADRVIFTGKRPHDAFNDDLANIDFVLIPYFEVGQSASATLSNALELVCPVVMSNTLNCKEYEVYFPACFEIFDIGNHYETKQKIISFDKNKIVNLKKQISLYSEEEIRKVYLKVYDEMSMRAPVPLPLTAPFPDLSNKIIRSSLAKAAFKLMPPPIKSLLRKLKRDLLCP